MSPQDAATPHDFLDQLTLRKYFYSFRDITIGGQCPCNGHASECPVDQATMVSEEKMKCFMRSGCRFEERRIITLFLGCHLLPQKPHTKFCSKQG